MHDKGRVTGKQHPLVPGHMTPQPLRGGNSGWSPADLESAYSLPSWQMGYGRTVGIVDAYDDPNVESDLATYRSNYGLPACSSANGCFRKVAQDGSTNYPAQEPSGQNWAAEETIDVEMISATCPNCHILLVESNSDLNADLLAGVDQAAAQGVNAVSMSWGTAEFSTETTDDSHFNHPGIAFVASSGDYGYGTTSWPAASPNVFAVGSTDLQTDQYGNWYETAWAGTTSGCSLYEPKPSYQHDTGCANRTMTDISADGGTGVSMYMTYPVSGWSTGWQGAGGTSVSAPLVAGILVLAPQDTIVSSGPGNWYSSAYTPGASSVNDITSGSTGSCGTYLCNAGPGYDGPTGLGSPDGIPPSANSRSDSELWGAANQGEAGPKPCSSGEPVVCATGDFYETATDLAVPGRGMALDLSRTYNALDAATATGPDALGWGWTDSYAMSLTTNAATGAVTVHQGDGATVTFTLSGSAYTAPGWVTATLVKNPDGTFNYTLPDQQAYKFSATGQLTSETGRNGYVTSLAYNGSGQLTAVTDPAGRSLDFAYNGSGQLTSVTDPAARQVSYAYDANGNLATVTDPAGAVTTYGYDSSHRLTTLTDPRGGRTTNVYDTSSRVTSQTDPMGRVTSFAYSSGTNTTSTTITDPASNATAETYNQYLQLISLIHGQGSPQAATWNYTYDAYTGEQTSVTDPAGHTTYATWDAQGNLTSLNDPLNRYSSATYDAYNDLTSSTDPAGVTTTYTYDAHLNLASVSTPLTGGSQVATTTYGYDPSHPGDVTSVTDPDGNTTHLAFDTNGDLSSVTDPDSNTTTAAYNGIGWRTSSVSPRGNAVGANPSAYTTSFGYDQDGRPTTVSDPLGHITTTAYDPDGNKTSFTDPDGHKTTYTYDADNEATLVTNPDGTTQGTSFDRDGNVTGQIDGNGHTTAYTYDALNRPTIVTDPLGRATSYTYDPAGLAASLKDANGNTTTYTYDAADELTNISYSDGVTPAVSYSYDADGRRTQMTDGTGTTAYTYDSLGRLTGQTDGAGNHVGYGYDLAGRQTTLTYPTGQAVTRSYDPANHLTAVTDWAGNKTAFSYDPDGNLTGQQRPNSTAAILAYDNADELTQITDTGPAGTILNLPYTYDPAGLVASTNATGGAQAVNQTFAYDNQNRLTAATVPAGTTGVTPDAYSYDAANNLTQITAGSLTTTLTHDNADQLLTTTNPVGITTYSHDNNGNRTGMVDATGNHTSYNYDQANRLTSSSGPPLSAADTTGAVSESATYTYNGDGLRVGKKATLNGVGLNFSFTWDISESVPAVLSDGTNSYIYGPGGTPIEQISISGTVTYLHTDRLGSVRALTNTTGIVTGTTNYTPYGQTINPTGATSPLGFNGQYTDPETGLIYLRARYYDPQNGQFLTVDPAVSITGQPYAYAGNNPVTNMDPLGLWGWADTWDVVGLASVGLAIVALTATGVGAASDFVTAGAEAAMGADLAASMTAEAGAGAAEASEIADAASVAARAARIAQAASKVGNIADAGAKGLDIAQCTINHDTNSCIGALLDVGGSGADRIGEVMGGAGARRMATGVSMLSSGAGLALGISDAPRAIKELNCDTR